MSDKQPSAADAFYAGGKPDHETYTPYITEDGYVRLESGGWVKQGAGGITFTKTRPWVPQSERTADLFYGSKS